MVELAKCQIKVPWHPLGNDVEVIISIKVAIMLSIISCKKLAMKGGFAAILWTSKTVDYMSDTTHAYMFWLHFKSILCQKICL